MIIIMYNQWAWSVEDRERNSCIFADLGGGGRDVVEKKHFTDMEMYGDESSCFAKQG
jgi:hypothetical protein